MDLADIFGHHLFIFLQFVVLWGEGPDSKIAHDSFYVDFYDILGNQKQIEYSGASRKELPFVNPSGGADVRER